MKLSMRSGLDLSLDKDPVPPAKESSRSSLLRVRGRTISARDVAPESVSAEAQRTRINVQRMLSEDQARRDLQDGRVSPVLYDLVRAAEGFFHPTWALVKGDRRKLGSVGRSTKTWLRRVGKNYVKGIKEYMDPGSDSPEEKQKMVLLKQYDRVRRAAEDGADRLQCTYCITLGQGDKPKIKLARSSYRPPFDKLARDAIEKAARLKPLKLDSGPVEACYQFTAKYFRVPPLPVVGCTFDEVHLTAECFYPFKKVLRSDVKLVGVHPITDSGG